MNSVTSYGIALVKKNKIKQNSQFASQFNENEYDILMIKKRLTYSYITFVKGIYNKNNENELLRLFNNMTVEEKFTIMSLNFNMMWYKLTLAPMYNTSKYNIKDISKFEKCKNKFEKSFLYDNGRKLLNILKRSKSSKKIWEIPKGTKNKNESALNAAIREFTEETNINKDKYKILYNINPITYTFTDENITYIYIYYIAVLLDNRYKVYLDFEYNSNIMEISDIKFININELKLINSDNKFINMVKKIIKISKPYFIN